MAQPPLSLRAYAAHRRAQGLAGGSLQAVQRAVKSERIVAALVRVDGVLRIADPEAADREWAANTDRSRAPASVKDSDDDIDPLELLDLEVAAGERTPLSKASAEEKHWKAKLARLNYEQRAGELVNAAEMAATMAADYTMVRTKLLGLPSKAKQRLPHLTLDDLATLDEIVREALEALADSGEGE